MSKCRDCNGTGLKYPNCSECGGTGLVDNPNPNIPYSMVCPICDGELCSTCNGRGEVK